MSPGRGPVRLVVRSRRVPVALTEIEFSHTTAYGVVSRVKKRSIVYDYVLDEGERRILEEVLQAAENSGLPLEVVDIGRAGPFSRIVSRLLERLPGAGLLPSRGRFVQHRSGCHPNTSCACHAQESRVESSSSFLRR